MEQDLNQIAELYDAVAEEWAVSFLGEHEKKPMDREMLAKFLLEVGPQTHIWEFGCGPGHTAAYLKKLGARISGLDLSEKTIELARRNHPDIAFRTGNMLDLDFDSGSVGAALALYAIVHFTREQAETAFGEIYRVLRPGGRFLFTYHIGEEVLHIDECFGKSANVDFLFFPSDFILDCIKRIGFESVEHFQRDPYPGVEYQSRRAYVFASKPETLRPR